MLLLIGVGTAAHILAQLPDHGSNVHSQPVLKGLLVPDRQRSRRYRRAKSGIFPTKSAILLPDISRTSWEILRLPALKRAFMTVFYAKLEFLVRPGPEASDGFEARAVQLSLLA